MLPEGFRSLKSLRVLNTYAVGASLAALTGAAFASMRMGHDDHRFIGISTLTTLFVGALWARSLRNRKQVTRFNIRQGWALSPLYAMFNASLAAGILLAGEGGPGSGKFLFGMIAGATFGAVIWVPALVLTLLCFGLPIARSQRLAERGLAGEESGEKVVGATSALLGLVATLAITAMGRAGTGSGGLVGALGISAMVAGAVAAVRAASRARRREQFVRDAEAGRAEGYRVDLTAEGKVLVRVEAAGPEAYRAGERFEAVYELAPDGEAKRALVAE